MEIPQDISPFGEFEYKPKGSMVSTYTLVVAIVVTGVLVAYIVSQSYETKREVTKITQ